MKLLLLLAVAVVVKGTALHFAPAAAVAETGDSAQFRSEDNLGNYHFGYQEDHTSGGSFRKEVGDAHGNVAGSYGLRDADGRVRVVNYIANDDGFKADIKTNEPGVEPADPADASINKPGPLVLAADVPVAVAQPAPVVAVPAAQPVAIKSFASFPAPVAAVKTVEVAQPIPYAFPAHAAVPVAKSAVIQPAPAIVSKSAVAVEEKAPLFPAPAAVAKTSSVSVEEHVGPVSFAFPEPAVVPVAKSSTTTVVQPAAYAFPAPAAVPVAKSSTTVVQPAAYAFPAPAAVPVAKSSTTVVQPAAYAFPAPAAVPVAKSSTTVVQPAAYAFPAPAAVPVAKSSTTVVEAAPVVVEERAPVRYAFPEPASVPVAKTHVAYSSPIVGPSSSYSYSTRVINNAPYHYGAFPYAAGYGFNPYYNLYSPVVSYAGPVLRFNNIAYPGYPVVKK